MRLSFNLIKWNAFDNTPNVIWLARYRHDSSKILFMWSTYNFSRIPFDNIMFFTFPILFLIVVVFIFITMRYSKLSKQLFNLKLKTRVGKQIILSYKRPLSWISYVFILLFYLRVQYKTHQLFFRYIALFCLFIPWVRSLCTCM